MYDVPKPFPPANHRSYSNLQEKIAGDSYKVPHGSGVPALSFTTSPGYISRRDHKLRLPSPRSLSISISFYFTQYQALIMNNQPQPAITFMPPPWVTQPLYNQPVPLLQPGDVLDTVSSLGLSDSRPKHHETRFITIPYSEYLCESMHSKQLIIQCQQVFQTFNNWRKEWRPQRQTCLSTPPSQPLPTAKLQWISQLQPLLLRTALVPLVLLGPGPKCASQ